MKHHLTKIALFGIVLLAQSIYALAQERKQIQDSLYSDILGEMRRIEIIYRGDQIEETGRKYEAWYVLDGEWYREQIPFIQNFVTNAGYAPPTIFVVIPNTYVDGANLRNRDFSPTRPGGDSRLGGADNFHAFLKEELIPYVESKYPIQGRSLVGSSFSGLFAVYAFVKEPGLFRSYVASDPNINWDNHLVTKLASEKLNSYAGIKSSLFIAGLDHTAEVMGIAGMDSVLTRYAPKGFPWRVTLYQNETHYSVQHKAFYDGFRFSHFGYSDKPIEFHPMNGILEPGKPISILMINQNPAVRFTTDGSVPTINSPQTMHEAPIDVMAPAKVHLKSFCHRAEYNQDVVGIFEQGAFSPPKSKIRRKAPLLTWSYFAGEWNSIPDFSKMKPVESGPVNEQFALNGNGAKTDGAYVIEGFLEIPDAAHYVFGTGAKHGSRLFVGDRLLIDHKGPDGPENQSYVVPLKKGFYPIRVELMKKKDSPEVRFVVFRTTSDNPKWWESRYLILE